MDMRAPIIRLLERAGDLPTLPDVALCVNAMVNDPDVSAADVARVMEQDPALTVRILKVANAAAFGATERVPGVAAAVARLGLREVRNVIMTMSVISAFRPTAGVDYPRFWKHAISTAFAARILLRHAAKLAAEGLQDELFTAGMLHDIGVLLLDLYAGRFYRRVTQATRAADADLYKAELEALGVDHAEVGAVLLYRWHLPAVIVEAVRWHHDPCRAPPGACRAVAQLVHLANFICNNQGMDNGLSGFPVKFSESAWFDAGLREEAVPEIIAQVNAEVAKSEVLLAVAQAGDARCADSREK